MRSLPPVRLGILLSACLLGCQASESTPPTEPPENEAAEFAAIQSPDAETLFAHPDTAQLARAVVTGDLPAIAAGLKAGVSADAQGLDGVPLLMWSILHSSHAGCEALLAASASPTIADDSGDCALTLAARHPDTAFLHAMLARTKDVDVPGPGGTTALALAAGAGLAANVQSLLSAGADPNRLDRLDRGPLYCAVAARSAAAMRLLLDAGAASFQADVDGCSPYELALRARMRPLVDCFAERVAPGASDANPSVR